MSAYQALYRKYRPQTFDDLVGQQAVTQTIKQQLQSGRLAHAYLFTGSRGTGKTSSAKILAKAVNCESPQDGNPCNCCSACRAIDSGACMDVLEIDAASNNGVDNVRDLRDDAVYTPSQVKMRVYIIDEVHMLSISAFNALLKIIEEPPQHLLFILATTELHKVPATILSRCQRFSFRRISQEDIAARLQYVAYQENISLDESAARVLARLADGALRDGLSLLDQCAGAAGTELTADKVYNCLGLAGLQECTAIMEAVAARDSAKAMAVLDDAYSRGKDMGAMLDELACLIRDLMILQTAPKQGIAMLSGVATDGQVKSLDGHFSPGELVYMLNIVQKTLSEFTRSASRRVDTELCILNLCQPQLHLDAQSLNARLSALENRIKNAPVQTVRVIQEEAEEELPPIPDDWDAPPEDPVLPMMDEAPVEEQTTPDFWPAVAAQLRKELKPPVSGYFAPGSATSLQAVFRNSRLELLCDDFLYQYFMTNRPQLLTLIGEKVSDHLGRKVSVVAVDRAAKPAENPNLRKLMDFGKAHPDVVKIKQD